MIHWKCSFSPSSYQGIVLFQMVEDLDGGWSAVFSVTISFLGSWRENSLCTLSSGVNSMLVELPGHMVGVWLHRWRRKKRSRWLRGCHPWLVWTTMQLSTRVYCQSKQRLRHGRHYLCCHHHHPLLASHQDHWMMTVRVLIFLSFHGDLCPRKPYSLSGMGERRGNQLSVSSSSLCSDL